METGENKVKSILKEILNTSIYLLIVICIAYLIVTYVGQRTRVSGGSMESTLSSEDHLLVDKISYRFNAPERFDIIVFPFQYDEELYYIKRIIGMPGETIRIDTEGNIYINDEILEEDYGREVIENPGRAIEPITLGDDEYFVMGDNRNNSSDSRDPSVGNIHRDDIIGKAFIRIWPLSKFGILKHQ
ncbi:MAG: signal peptidase I [Lachnospiraceae bacterium]|nr:signal peptidase I [Lachnospiraceae bacterium]